jgi:hypothetical protein
LIDCEERRDLDEAADRWRHRQDGGEHEADRLAFKLVMKFRTCDLTPPAAATL